MRSGQGRSGAKPIKDDPKPIEDEPKPIKQDLRVISFEDISTNLSLIVSLWQLKCFTPMESVFFLPWHSELAALTCCTPINLTLVTVLGEDSCWNSGLLTWHCRTLVGIGWLCPPLSWPQLKRLLIWMSHFEKCSFIFITRYGQITCPADIPPPPQ